ncbi:MAG TPA: hypothetical protein VML93_04705 [Mycobacterium sp.]|nr:hypothetical protein [Mycobacterium sp.]HTQ16640.1 hypothetical protein [Mycobacterium sp.]
MSSRQRPYRVIQWGTGSVGKVMLAAILDHRPDLELVGVRVYSDDKDGADVGTLLGRDPVGVRATIDPAAVLEVEADCVLYTPRDPSIADVCALLASGKNVVTTAFLFHPKRIDAADRDRLAAACRQGGTSVHGTGINPGNLSAVLPLALTGMSRTVDKITLQERADWSVYESTSITFDNMGFGQPVDAISPTATRSLAFTSALFVEQVWFLADALRADIDEITTSFTRAATLEEHVRSASVATAMQALNAVPAVCEAPPGFASAASLPLIRSYAGFGNV